MYFTEMTFTDPNSGLLKGKGNLVCVEVCNGFHDSLRVTHYEWLIKNEPI